MPQEAATKLTLCARLLAAISFSIKEEMRIKLAILALLLFRTPKSKVWKNGEHKGGNPDLRVRVGLPAIENKTDTIYLPEMDIID